MLAAIVAAGTLVSCGNDSFLDSASERGARGGESRHQSAHEKRGAADKARSHQDKSEDRSDGRGSRSTDADGGVTARSDTDKSESTTDTATPQGPKAGTGSSKPAVSCFSDATGDMEGTGSAPSYADLARGCVREDGAQIVLEATAVGAPPARMPDEDTHLAFGFALELPSGKKVYVSAEATDGGWTAFLSQAGARKDLPAPSLSGDQVRITVPVTDLGGAERLDWRVESSWLKSTLVSTEYAFDDAPAGGGSITFVRR